MVQQEDFEENGLKPPKTFDEFFDVAEKLKKKGVTPLALGDKEPWTATHLFETVLLGTLGPEDYNKVWSGELAFDDPKVKKALETFKRMLRYTNSDHAARNWQDAAQMVAKGEAAMNVMGDWVKGYFTTDLKLKPNKDFGWAPTPETEGTFMVITDTFGLPKGAKKSRSDQGFPQGAGLRRGAGRVQSAEGIDPRPGGCGCEQIRRIRQTDHRGLQEQSADAQFGPRFRGCGRIPDGGEQDHQHLRHPGGRGPGRGCPETGGHIQRDRKVRKVHFASRPACPLA